MTVKECYDKLEADYDNILYSIRKDELVKHFALKFLEDKSLSKIEEGLEKKNAELAFRGAHTLKGLSANLGFTRLYEISSKLTEELRPLGLDSPNLPNLFNAVKEEYIRTVDILKELSDSKWFK